MGQGVFGCDLLSATKEKPESGHPGLFRGTVETPVH